MIPRFKKKKNSEIFEGIINWFWVILFISSVIYLRWLLVEMHTETSRLTEERQRIQDDIREERAKSQKLYQEFYAGLNETINEAIKALNKGEIPPSKYFNP